MPVILGAAPDVSPSLGRRPNDMRHVGVSDLDNLERGWRGEWYVVICSFDARQTNVSSG